MTQMQKIIATAAFSLLSWNAFSQVGINTSSPAAQLEVKSSNQAAPLNTDGLIIPKIDTFPAVNPTAEQQSMMVYLTTASGANQPGFYFWDNASTSWKGIGNSKKGWDLTGDAGTDPATNFIGTSDGQPLVVKTNNAERMRVLSNGNVGIGTATPQTRFHAYGGASGMTPNPFSVATIEGNVSSYMSLLSAGETGMLFGANGNSTSGAIVYNNPSLPDGLMFRTNGNINRMIIGPTGNVVVGNSIPGARMEINASSVAAPANTDGLLVPRVVAFPAVNPGSAQNGMMVFLMATVGAFKPGFYYWENATTSWKGVGSSGTPNDWGLTGNIGTNPANNFIGTGDDVDVVFKRNNVRSGLIGSSNTAFGYATLNPANTGLYNTAIGNWTLPFNTTGYSNTAIGFQSLRANTQGFRNVAVGTNALVSNVSGSYSTAIGTDALMSNTTGGSNTVVGDYSMSKNTEGLFNVAMGNSTLKENIDGDGNTAIGHRSLFMNANGNNNTAVGLNSLYNNTATGIVGIGYQSLANNTSGTFNTAVGTASLQLNQTGTSNTAVGHSALANNAGSFNTAVGLTSLGMNTSGIQNTAFGYQSLINNTTGNANVAVGHNALFSNQTASSLVAVGNVALYSNTTGLNNVAVGGGALHKNTTASNSTAMGGGALYNNNGDYNTGFGSNALVNNTSGYDNTSNGAFSMVSNTIGFRNTAQGGAALNANVSGNYNVASGYFALGGNQTGHANTAIGSYAALANVGGNDNTVMGYQALHDNVGGSFNLAVGANANYHNISGDNNTALGNAAMSNTTSGNNNTAVGTSAMVTQTAGDNNIAIGVNSALPSLTGSNQLSIANVVYGSNMEATTTGKIAIGKTVPDAKFEVAASNAAAPANTDGMLIPRVNTFPVTNPTAAQNGMMIYLNNTVGVYAAGFYYWDNTAVSWTAVGAKTGWSTFGNAGTSPATHFMGTTDSNDMAMKINNAEVMRLEVGGNVGIGTNNPTTKLEVNGFTKLGSTAPAIKTLKLTGTTNSSQGVQVPVVHGLNSSKILSVSVLVEYAAGMSVPPNYGGSAGYEFDYYISASSITVWTKSGNSGNILSKPFRVLVTYEE